MSNQSDILTAPLNIPENIPKDWKWVYLLDCTKPKQWATISSSELKKNGYPVYGANGLIGYYDEYNHLEETIAVTCRGATCGTVNLIPAYSYITGNSMSLDNLDLATTDLRYLYYSLSYRNLSDVISGSAQPQITRDGLKNVLFPSPKKTEQQKIAAILSSVDEVIEKTEAQISKLQDLKKGMMQELLTKGIGHSEFKDVPGFGRIPKGWSVVKLGDVTEESAFGPRFSSDLYDVNGNIGCIRTTDIDENWNIDYTTIPIARLNEQEFSNHILKDGDLLVTRSGTCGIVDVFKEQSLPIIVGAFLIRFRLKKNVVPLFLRYMMMNPLTQEKVQMMASGGVQKNLSGTNLKTLLIPLPEKEEQQRIVAVLDSVTNRISKSETKLLRIRSTKKALMQDLLTGKVRVKTD